VVHKIASSPTAKALIRSDITCRPRFRFAAGIAMGFILPALVFLTFRVAAVLADV
jgi:hypothetical protein